MSNSTPNRFNAGNKGKVGKEPLTPPNKSEGQPSAGKGKPTSSKGGGQMPRLKQNISNLDLLHMLLAILRGTGANCVLATLTEQFMARLITKPENLMCWNNTTHNVADRSNMTYTIAVVGDPSCICMKSQGKNTNTKVPECIREALIGESHNSAPTVLERAELANKTKEVFLS